jgi:serine/threonine protein kinase/sugar lactone lactonase YvrE
MSSSLHTGTILGSYRIVAPLGAGGMGEVYQAHDSKLDRAVALKILPPELVRDADRVRRFVQEARSASSLSHPNIVTIYDIDQAVPVEEGAEPTPGTTPLHYIAMELVEGSTLRQLFADRSIEPRTLLAHLAQAAEGLAKAHSAGIVHRDLKPENIMVTRDGYAKVLDFGLAKLTERKTPGGALTAAPTALPDQATQQGAVMGTVGYMSPEQAMGKPVDHRTDVFAFGCLLYEAATGRRPFTGESQVDVLHAIVREKPVPVEEIAPQIPTALVRTIRRCLAKDPDRRYQSMKDLALELHDMVDEWETLATPSGPVSSASVLSGAAAPPAGGLGRAGWAALAIAAVVLTAVGIALWRSAARSAPESTAFQAMTITAATSNGNVEAASLSPDGRYLVYVRSDPDGSSLWLRQLTSASDVQLLPPQGVGELRNPVFTPDGSYIDYTLTKDQQASYFKLYRVPVLGGAPRKILDDVDSPVTYSPDGRRIAFLRFRPEALAGDLVVASANGSEQRTLVTHSMKENRSFEIGAGLGPAWSPDGSTIAVSVLTWAPEVGGKVELIDAESGRERRLGVTDWFVLTGLAWLPDGSSLVVAGFQVGAALAPQLWRLSFPDGAPTRVTNDSQRYRGASVSADGTTLASVQRQSSSTLWSRSRTAPANEKQLTSSSREEISYLRTDAGGNLFFTSWGGKEAVITRLDPTGGERLRVTSREVFSRDCQVSRDGRTLVVRSLTPDGKVVLFTMDADGGHQRRAPERGAIWPYALAPDGSSCLVHDERGIWRQPLNGGEATLLVDNPRAWPIEFSPDGSRFAYEDLRVGPRGPEDRIVIVAAAGGAPAAELPAPTTDSGSIHWTPDGKALTFRRKEGSHFNVWRLPLDGGPPTRITDFASFEMGDYAFSPDGRTLFYTKVQSTSDAVLIEHFR